MRIAKGLIRLEEMGEIECNGECDYCLYKHAKDTFNKLHAMYDVLYGYDAISSRAYNAGKREIAGESLLLYVSCEKLNGGGYKV